jgi:hypothetical protein
LFRCPRAEKEDLQIGRHLLTANAAEREIPILLPDPPPPPHLVIPPPLLLDLSLPPPPLLLLLPPPPHPPHPRETQNDLTNARSARTRKIQNDRIRSEIENEKKPKNARKQKIEIEKEKEIVNEKGNAKSAEATTAIAIDQRTKAIASDQKPRTK